MLHTIRRISIACCMLGLWIMGAQTAKAQQVYCGTDEVHAQYLKSNTEAEAMMEAFEAYYRAEVEVRSKMPKRTSEELRGSEALKYTIPCVVHVIHNNGVENISDAQVISQFKRMNEDFRRMPETQGYGSGADYQMEFELASKDPNGNPTNGIVRVQSGLTVHNMDSQQSALKNLSKWPQNQYLNIWIVRSIASTQPGVLAYATFPSNGGNSNDGIVNSYFCWGTTGAVDGSRALGRVGTHEVGHWVALFHPFQPSSGSSGCTGAGTASCTSQGDRICDTPPVAAATFGNPARRNSCQEPNDLPDRTRNYMDYTDDPHKDEFSYGQRTRSHLSMENDNFRRNMYTMTNLEATGTGPYRLPEANFVAENKVSCINAPVQFTDWSNGHPNSWSWSFPGGTPATSNDRHPVVTYAAPGVYDVTLTVGNLTGNSTAITKTGYVTITDAVRTFPFSEDFEGTFPPDGWHTINPDNSTFNLFVQGNVGGYSNSSKSARMNMFINRMYDQLDALVSPTLNLSNAVEPKLYFDLAYAQYADLYSDTLRIYASEDCGHTWTELFEKGGAELASKSTPQTSNFSPAADEWTTLAVDLSGYIGKDNVRIKFETQNRYGNSLYIDNVAVREPWAVSTDQELMGALRIAAQPNPFQQHLTLSIYNPGFEMDAQIVMQDITGRTVLTQTSNALVSGKSEIQLNAEGLNTGVYFVKVSNASGAQQTLKVVKQ